MLVFSENYGIFSILFTKSKFLLGKNKYQKLFLNALKKLSFYNIRNETPPDISVVNISFLLSYIKLHYKVYDIPGRIKIFERTRQWRKYWNFFGNFLKNFLFLFTDLQKQKRTRHYEYLKSGREQLTISERRASISLPHTFPLNVSQGNWGLPSIKLRRGI